MGMGRRDSVSQLMGGQQKHPGTAKAVFTCVTNYSHPFQNRTLSLEWNIPVKIGRGGAYVMAAPNNAIFDCVVISRDHARIWFKDGKFYLQDTKSSNGTFVNNELIGEKVKDSPAKHVYSGDTVQFGSAVFSPDMKARLGAIIGVLTLYLPDGSEYMTRPASDVTPVVPTAHLYQLASYLEEAAHSEQKLKKKLAVLQHIVETTAKAASEGWKASVNEDCLLGRIDVLQRQVDVYSKKNPEDNLRKELIELTNSQKLFRELSKKHLEKALNEKNEAVQKYKDIQKQQGVLELECEHYKTTYKRSQDDLRDLGQKYSIYFEKYQQLSQKVNTERKLGLQEKCNSLEQEKLRLKESIDEEVNEKEKLQKRLEAYENNAESSTEVTDSGSSRTVCFRMSDNSKTSVAIGDDIGSVSKSKFTVTSVNADLESMDVLAQDVFSPMSKPNVSVPEVQAQNIQSKIFELYTKVDNLEREEKCRMERFENIRFRLDCLRNSTNPNKDDSSEFSDEFSECIDSIENELALACLSDNVNKNKTNLSDTDLIDNVKDLNDSINNLKTENAKLTEHLSQLATEIKCLEGQRDLQQMDFKDLTLKTIEVNLENDILKEHLMQARLTANAKNNLAQELTNQKLSLEKISNEGTQNLTILQRKLDNEQLRQISLTKDCDLLRQELKGAHISLKKSQDEVKSLKLTIENVKAAPRTKDADSKMELEKTCTILQFENNRLKLECVEGEKNKRTLKAAQEDFVLLNQKLVGQMDIITQMQVNVTESEQRKVMFGSLVEELAGAKEMCSQLVDENADLSKKVLELQSQQDHAIYYCVPVVVAVIVLIAIVLYPNYTGIRSTSYSTIFED